MAESENSIEKSNIQTGICFHCKAAGLVYVTDCPCCDECALLIHRLIVQARYDHYEEERSFLWRKVREWEKKLDGTY